VEDTLEVPVLPIVHADEQAPPTEDERLELLAEELREAIRRKLAPPE
jgi:hypothetical protein